MTLDSGIIHRSSPDKFLPPIGQLPILGGIVLLVAFSGAITLAGILKYKVTVKAVATVRPGGELRIVQSAIEGTVSQIFVEANQPIKAGETVAILDASRLQTQKNQLQGSLQQNVQQQMQLIAQLAALNQQVSAETEQRNRTIAAAKASLSLNQRTYQDRLITTSAEVREATAAVELAREELTRYKQLSGTGAISEIQVGEKEAALKTAQARLERVSASLNPSPAEVNIAQEAIEQERAKGTATLAALSKEREQLLQKQAELQTQIDRDRKEFQQVETDLKNTIVRAPTSGIIQELNLRNQSQVVRLGDVIAQIAPSDAPLRIKAVVAVQDVDQVKVGQSVYMRVSACSYPDYGTLPGKVKSIAPDTIALSRTDGNATQESRSAAGKIYEVTIQPMTLTLQAHGQTCSIKSGMEGSVEIVSREETILQFFLRKARLLTRV